MMQFCLMAALVFLSAERQQSVHAFVQSPSRPGTSHLYADRAVDDNNFARFEASLQGDASSQNAEPKKKLNWQADLERLLNPTTSISQRQVLISELIEKNGEIRASVEKAMLDRNVRFAFSVAFVESFVLVCGFVSRFLVSSFLCRLILC